MDIRKSFVATVSGIMLAGSLSISALADPDPTVTGTISQTHAGVYLTCMYVNGQWYGVENIFPTQAIAELLAASDGATVKFQVYDPPRVIQCHGTQPALEIHDIDRAY